MACKILSGEEGACFYDSVTEVVFGPLFEDEQEAENFKEYIGEPREYTTKELVGLLNEFRKAKDGDLD